MGAVAYLASPFGFSEAGRAFMAESVLPALRGAGLDVLDPWDIPRRLRAGLERAEATGSAAERARLFRRINRELAAGNLARIDRSDAVIAVLDGTDVDSGVAAEVGYAYARGRRIIGYRGDFRDSGDNAGAIVNLQVEYLVRDSGGAICRDLGRLVAAARRLARGPAGRGPAPPADP